MEPGLEGSSREACYDTVAVIQMRNSTDQGDGEKWRGLKAISTVKI